jgi:hypothetical protein
VNENIQTTTEDQKLPERPARKRAAAITAEQKPARIRTELNIEKWPAIWNPTHSKIHSKSNVQPRTLERETNAIDGTRTISKVTINPIAHLGDLTTDDQRTLYALIKHWEDRGKPAHETAFSIRAVAKLLHKKGWGTNVIDAVTGSLERLRGTMLVWTRAYRSKDQRVEDSETVYINILSKLKIVRRKVDGHITTEAGYFQFDDNILKNLLTNYTKPFLFEVFIDIRGEIALKLYSYLDLIMADKYHFERCTRELFEDLGLKGASYRNPSKRKQNLESAFKELTGIMLTTGVLKSATIVKTKDGKDFKAVFHKAPPTKSAVANSEPATTFAIIEPVIINDYSKSRAPLTAQAQEIVEHFYKRFHGVERHHAQSRETAQALSLITQYGIAKARHIVDFAQKAAPGTNYVPQTFGGILQYTSRGAADFDRNAHRSAPNATAPKQPTEQQRQESELRARGESRLAVLTAEQYTARLEQAEAELFKQNPFMARQPEGSKIREGALRSWMVRQLADEKMDLVVVDGVTDPEAIRRKLLPQNLPL